jgi:hypothetical protein
MDNYEALLIVLLSVFAVLLLLIIIFVSCWYLSKKTRRSRARNHSGDAEQPLIARFSQPRIERAQAQERSSLLTCHFYIRTTGEYIFHSQLSQLGSDPEKSWFLITPIAKTGNSSSNVASHILTIHPKPDRLNHLTDEDNTAVYFRTLNSLFGRLFHPYIESIVRLDFLYTQKSVITVKRYQRLGSLKDLLHGVTPTANFHVRFLLLFFSFILKLKSIFRVNILIEVQVYLLNVFVYILVNYSKVFFFFNQNQCHQCWIYIVEISLQQVQVFKLVHMNMHF